MKRKRKSLRFAIYTLGLLSMPMLGGCIEETFPSSAATAEQVATSSTALYSIVNSLTNYTIDTKTSGYTDYTDAGLPGIMIACDVMCEDAPVSSTTNDWYARLGKCSNASWGGNPYYFFYTFINKANDVLKPYYGKTSFDEVDESLRPLLGNLYGFRTMSYLYLTRLFEYQPTGYATLDNAAKADSIMGLTVPILDAIDYNVADLVKNPRAPFPTMYRFILADLNRAEELLEGYQRPKVSFMDQSVIHGLKARFWMELASRFGRSEADLAKQLAAEGSADGYADLKIAKALDCYANALAYAEKVIGAGYTPLTASEWYDVSTGFNKPTSSWVWGSYISSQAENPARWYGFPTYMSSEASWGWGRDQDVFRCIGSYLYGEIPDVDWRKISWIAPDDAGDADNSDYYYTALSGSDFEELPAYANLKFRVPNIANYQSGLTCCTPFMRVEEMYLLRAEALLHTQSRDAAAEALNAFVNNYRYSHDEYFEGQTYDCKAVSDYDFIQKLMLQRRIEFWGEGIVFFDYKRLRLGINRTKSKNFPDEFGLVTNDGYVAPWMNAYIPESAISTKDASFKGNPNFNGVVTAASTSN